VKYTYTYDAVGNITSKSDQGTYDYEGDQGGSYANPHAVTSIGGTDFTYDNNGNMLTVTGGLSNTWNYKNQLAQAVIGAVTTTYAYDHAGQRVKYANGTTTTVYPSKNYNVEGSNQIKHIFAGDQVVATVKGTGATAAVFSVHTDHLSGSSAVTNSSGVQEEVMDYFPFGEIRLDQKAGTFDEQRKFGGHEYDAETELTYMNARYYKSDIGRFVSQDPAFLLVGDNRQFEQRYNRTLALHLVNPQSLNSYSYTNNNPVTHGDESGEILPVMVGIGAVAWGALEVGLSVYDGYTTYQTFNDPNASLGEKATTLSLFGFGLVGPFGGYATIGNKTDDLLKLAKDYKWGRAETLIDHAQRHGPDFGVDTAEEYAKRAQSFLQEAKQKGYEMLYNAKEQAIKTYDKATNTFGTYNMDGTTKSFFKPDPAVHGYPTNVDYWNAQKGDRL
jgi:RHS repeat-associated protein